MTTTTITTDPQAAVLLRAVLETPEDDFPRLMLAEWLDERGDPRGEFIRVQCELASDGCECPGGDTGMICWRCRRERELLTNHWREWLTFPVVGESDWLPAFASDIGKLGSASPVAYFARGFVEAITLSAAAFLGGGECPWTNCQDPYVMAGRTSTQGYRPCPDCNDTLRTAGHAATLFAAAPITAVRLSDREPGHVEREPGFAGWTWFVGDAISEGGSRNHIPNRLWHHLKHGYMNTDGDAHAALSAACVSLARSLVDPPLPDLRQLPALE